MKSGKTRQAGTNFTGKNKKQWPIATETRRAKTNKKIPKLACRPAQGNSVKAEMELDLDSQSSESLKAILKEIEGECR